VGIAVSGLVGCELTGAGGVFEDGDSTSFEIESGLKLWTTGGVGVAAALAGV